LTTQTGWDSNEWWVCAATHHYSLEIRLVLMTGS